ncbi:MULTISPECIES: peptidyl-tRNA hydrolase [unclassified Kitasatospora]|uniref:peptidyl-tRNA hydrolase n=1 Tax=unclassified Kitasatospora TaxID=2633591 RepID=UPI0007097F51|nr:MULTISPECIES: peptidyl-tRNA hydrolase [unclassified Kitasatospora]KQV04543.1 peptidyl-tRNA hydrolase [Kitasatospora sp. Root107]KRB60929.1 peptidyl-tRNA hydrolase [Kitasatospora sp. Root187]
MTTSPFTAPSTPAASDPRDEQPQYVLPLLVRLEKAEPPARTDALETSARAVLTLLADPRVTEPEGEWAERVAAWEDARIRKVVRRARGGEWRKANELPGITVSGASAEVRVFPPVPLDGWPKELAKLQVSGTDLDDPAEPGPVEPGVPVLWLNPELEMSAGKTMAQTGHAAQLAWWRLDDAQRKEWAEAGFRLAVRTAAKEDWAELMAGHLPVVHDAGFTEIAPGPTVALEGGERYCPTPRLRRP